MSRFRFYHLALAALAAGLMAVPAHAGVITQWSFAAPVAAPDNTPAASTGAGSMFDIGMTNSYVETNGPGGATLGTGSVSADDVLSTPGTANPAFVEDAWRVRGGAGLGTSGTANNGWSLSAPQYSQGLEMDVSTAGYQNISVSFDWYCTTHGIKDLQVQYNLNTGNPAGWTDFGPLQIATNNDWYGDTGAGTPTTPTNSFDLSAILGANNDATFGIRLVSAYDPTYAGVYAPTYTDASGNNKVTGNANNDPLVYNNNSGNWRFDNFTIGGVAVPVPEPSSLCLGGLALLGLSAFGIRRKK